MTRRATVTWLTKWVPAGLLLIGGLGCGVTDEGTLPPDVQDPETLHTPAGAMARYRGVLAQLPPLFDSLMTETGILTDELAALPGPIGTARTPYTNVDSRQDLSSLEVRYNGLQRLRAQAREARGFLEAYAPDSSTALAGHMYAIEGYAEIFLADLFCSGIPLSTVDFGADYTLAPGSTTEEVYRHAVTLFDSALAITSDSVQLQHFAAIGRGRALLALGQYADAAAATAAIPDNYQYQVVFVEPFTSVLHRLLAIFGNSATGSSAAGYRAVPATPNVGNAEGGNGLDYRASHDPRTPAVARPGTDPLGNTMYFPAKYPVSGTDTLTVASGIEARLIEAEAALQSGASNWLAILNALRTDGTFDTTATTPPDTLWHAGSGGVAGLAPLADPGTVEGRTDLLFRERAFWLYLTAHRQGDLRRLIRQYLRTPDEVYPTGSYAGGSGGYGDEIVARVPDSEQSLNSKYTGCFNYGA